MSFERESDRLRIGNVIKKNPTAFVLSVAEREVRPQDRHNSLFVRYPGRYDHISVNFKNERGMESVAARLKKIGLPSRGVLDYFFLQETYYPERYGTNWLEGKLDPLSEVTEKMILYLRPIFYTLTLSPPRLVFALQVGMTEMVLPIDEGGAVEKMIQESSGTWKYPYQRISTFSLLDSDYTIATELTENVSLVNQK